MVVHRHIRHLKRHRNALYGIVVFLLVLQIVSFISVSSQTSKISAEQEYIRNQLDEGLSDINNEIDGLRTESQFNINSLAQEVAQQKSDIQGQIDLIKDSQQDFSGVIEDVIRGVVSVVTDRSAGSGFAVNEEGYIITNYHVITGSSLIKIQTFDTIIYDASLVVSDPFADLALLKINGVVDPIDFADSNAIQIGEKVIAIGNPLGLSFTVTEGIVSAVNRVGPNGLPKYIQTDTNLNPGNSGGPLINKEGKVIGINNFKIGGAEGIGFALESNEIKERINLLVNFELI